MRGASVVQVLEGFKGFAGTVPLIGASLSGLIELAVMICKLSEVRLALYFSVKVSVTLYLGDPSQQRTLC